MKSQHMKKYQSATHCIHGKRRDTQNGLNTPVHPSTAYRYRETPHNVYPRYYNTVNQEVVVEKLCELEGGEDGLLFSSGMAAISTTLLSLLEPGDHAIFSKELYGGTFYFIEKELGKRGIEYSFASDSSTDAFADEIRPQTKLIYFETPSNPLLTILSLSELTALAKSNGITTMLDNTFATPINQTPLKWGIDIVIHSGTKYLSGHSDLSFGAVITSKALKNKILPQAVNYGGNLNAMDVYLIERSLKTLALRVERQNANARQVAIFLQQRPEVKKVYYPGLAQHPGNEIAARQMKGFGGMIAFELAVEQLFEVDLFLDQLLMIQPALSLGGVETIICSPAQTSHIKLPKEERIDQGITDQLLRLSVGIEALADILADLAQALDHISSFVNKQTHAI